MIEPRPLPPAVSALEVRLGLAEGTLADEDLARATAALEDASALVLAEVPARIAEQWETTGAKPVVHAIVLKAARREFENPQGLSAETMGEHTVQLSASSGVYLTDREIKATRRAALGRSSFVGSVRTPSAFDTPELATRRDVDDWGTWSESRNARSYDVDPWDEGEDG